MDLTQHLHDVVAGQQRGHRERQVRIETQCTQVLVVIDRAAVRVRDTDFEPLARLFVNRDGTGQGAAGGEHHTKCTAH